MSLPVLIGFAGVLVAAVATGLLAGRCVRQPGVGLVLCTAAALALTAALAAQSIGFANGFGPVTFRAVQLLELLLAPLWLAWGLAELTWRSEAARFGARLICAALTVVGGVILATDPLFGPPFRKSWPLATVYYQPFSRDVLDLTQVVAVVIAVVSVGLAAARPTTDRRWTRALAGAAAVAFAVLLTAGLRFSLPARSAYPLDGILAAVLVWFGATSIPDRPGRAGRDREPAGYQAPDADGYEAPEAQYADAANGHRHPGGAQELDRGSAGSREPGRPGAPYGPNGLSEPGAPRGPDEPGGPGGPGPRQPPTPPGPDRHRGAPAPGANGRPLPPDAQSERLAPTATGAKPARPYGRIVIFTLLEDRVADFDRLAEQAADEVRVREPDTLVFVIHLVPNAPLQRIFYEIYRDRAAFDSHEGQPYIQRFVAERRSCVLATNMIELRLKYAKVAPLPSPQLASAPPPSPQLVSGPPPSPQLASVPPVSAVARPGARPQLPPDQSQGTPVPRGSQPLQPLPPGPDRRPPAADRRYGGT
jgi:quinol monooxygenase YgiN